MSALMRRGGMLLLLGGCLPAWPSEGSSSVDTGNPIVILVNKDFPVETMTTSELADYYTGEKQFLPNRVKVQPILAPSPIEKVNDRFVKLVLGTTARDFRHESEARVYRGESSVRPIQAKDVVETARAVLYHGNTIAILDSVSLALLPPEFSRGFKVLRINGLSPEAPGYPLR